jgi:hypothetical protein
MVDSRKFRVGLISLGAVLVIFLLYSLVSRTPRIEIDMEAESRDIADSNIAELQDRVGKIGQVGVGNVKKAEFIQLNKDKQVDIIFGFEILLHQEGDEWELEKPYMDIFRYGVECKITADRGNAIIDTAADRSSPKYAKFAGNVVAHIVPGPSSDIQEGFLYLDDVTFLSDESQFSTPGPVKYVSQNAQMLGRGLELINNEQAKRIEFLRVFHLESLRMKAARSALFPSETTKAGGSDDPNSQIKTQQPQKTVTTDDSQKVKSSSAASKQSDEPNEPERYRCVFSKNVVLDTLEQLIFAAEKLSINNIFKPVDSEEQADKADPFTTEMVDKTDTESAGEAEKGLEPNSPGSPNSPLPTIDITVTCDNGLVVTPMDSPVEDTNSVPIGSDQLIKVAAEKMKKLENTNNRATFIAQNIDYCAYTHDTIATGPSELKFHTGDLFRSDANDANEVEVPVTISARKKAQFLPAARQAIFEGDCQCRMLREDPNTQQKFTLSAPKLTVDLSGDNDKKLSASAADIEHLTADGGVVQLDTSKWAGEELLGFTKLKCRRFDYDAAQQVFEATGPGIIAIDNSKISEPNSDGGRFSFRRRCYAVVENFDTLKYFLETNQVIAEAESPGLIVSYVPVIKGKYGRRVTVTAGRVVLDLVETADGRTELAKLRATRGVTYEEEDVEFAGSTLFYAAGQSKVLVRGDQSHSCIFNGIPVDEIEYDLQTRKAKFKIVGPGALQRK